MEMGKKLLMMILVVLLVERSSAVTLCKMDDNGFAACKPSVTQPNPVDPTPECCKAVSGADLPCLCSYKNSMVLPALGIDPNLAMGLPAKCNITPPANC